MKRAVQREISAKRKIVNCTPHDINVLSSKDRKTVIYTIPPEKGKELRVSTLPLERIDDLLLPSGTSVPIYKRPKYTEITDFDWDKLPKEEQVDLIVSTIAAEKIPPSFKGKVLVPNEVIRENIKDAEGKIIKYNEIIGNVSFYDYNSSSSETVKKESEYIVIHYEYSLFVLKRENLSDLELHYIECMSWKMPSYDYILYTQRYGSSGLEIKKEGLDMHELAATVYVGIASKQFHTNYDDGNPDVELRKMLPEKITLWASLGTEYTGGTFEIPTSCKFFTVYNYIKCL